jgi:TRAP-type mannitol/chloroaromatic compound transport system permease large subunit
MGAIVRGSAPYVLLMVAIMALVMLWPQIALWLPGTMMR